MEKTKFTQEELDKLAAWLKSDEGREKIRNAQTSAEEFCKALEENMKIDPKILNEPFNI